MVLGVHWEQASEEFGLDSMSVLTRGLPARSSVVLAVFGDWRELRIPEWVARRPRPCWVLAAAVIALSRVSVTELKRVPSASRGEELVSARNRL